MWGIQYTTVTVYEAQYIFEASYTVDSCPSPHGVGGVTLSTCTPHKRIQECLYYVHAKVL